MKALFKSNNLIGDSLYISVPLRQWIMEHRDWQVYLQTLPDHIAALYQGMTRDLKILHMEFNRPEGEFDFEFNFDVNKAFKLSDQKRQHISQSYAEMLGVSIQEPGPVYEPLFSDCQWDFHGCNLNGNLILISMFSASCASREGKPPTKMPAWDKWIPMLKLLRSSYPNAPIKMLGAPTDHLPDNLQLLTEELHIERMHGIPLNELAMIMKSAKFLLTLDNGMAHLAASQKCPTFLMYPKCLAPHYILPIGNKEKLEWIHIDPSTVHARQLEMWLSYCIRKVRAREKAKESSASIANT